MSRARLLQPGCNRGWSWRQAPATRMTPGEARPRAAVEVPRHTFKAGEVRLKELLRGEGLVAAAG